MVGALPRGKLRKDPFLFGGVFDDGQRATEVFRLRLGSGPGVWREEIIIMAVVGIGNRASNNIGLRTRKHNREKDGSAEKGKDRFHGRELNTVHDIRLH